MSYTTETRVDREMVPPRRPSAFGSTLVLVAFLAIAFAVAGFGAVTTIGTVDGFYSRIAHVAWTPPNWVFGPVWTVLYAAIGVAGWLVWRARRRVQVTGALTLFVVQLVVNCLWTPVFFGGHTYFGGVSLWAGLAVILVLDVMVAALVATCWPVSRAAAILLMPYLVWILFATTLNWGDAVLNAAQ